MLAGQNGRNQEYGMGCWFSTAEPRYSEVFALEQAKYACLILAGAPLYFPFHGKGLHYGWLSCLCGLPLVCHTSLCLLVSALQGQGGSVVGRADKGL
jgi:hypothetical protein